MIDDYRDFAREFKIITGLDLCKYNRTQMLRRLTAFRMKKDIHSLTDLSERLKLDTNLLEECLARLTINVTEFFRDREYWQVLRAKVADLAGESLPLRFWSAGCASGEEPYSLSFMLFGLLPRRSREILASDLSQQALAIARAGVYAKAVLKNLSPKEIALYFYPVDSKKHKIKDLLRQGVSFFHHDLLSDPYPTNLDVVLCRNVIIYFTEKAKKDVLNKIVRRLNPGGLLFVGGSEQIITPREYGLERDDVYIYRKK